MATIWGLPSILVKGPLLNPCRHYELCLENCNSEPSTETNCPAKNSQSSYLLELKAADTQRTVINENRSTFSSNNNDRKKKKKRKVKEDASSKQEAAVVGNKDSLPLDVDESPTKPSCSSPSPPKIAEPIESLTVSAPCDTYPYEDEIEIDLESEAYEKEMAAQTMDYYNKWTSYLEKVVLYEDQRQQQLAAALIEQESKLDEANPPGFTPPSSPQPFTVTPESGSYSNNSSFQPPYYSAQHPHPPQPSNYWEGYGDEFRSSSGGNFSASNQSDSAPYFSDYQRVQLPPPPPPLPESRFSSDIIPPFPPFPPFPDWGNNQIPEIPPPPPPFAFDNQPPPENNWLTYDQPYCESGPVSYHPQSSGDQRSAQPSPQENYRHPSSYRDDYYYDERSYDSYHSRSSRHHEPDYRHDYRDERESRADYPPPPPKTSNQQLLSSIFSPSDCDYRAVWIEQVNGRYAPANHPFYHVDPENVMTKPYSDVFHDEEVAKSEERGRESSPWHSLPPFRDAYLFKTGTWQHLRDIPRFTRLNLSKINEQEARALVEWFRNERREGFQNIWALQKRIDSSLKMAISLETQCKQQKHSNRESDPSEERRVVRTHPYEPVSDQERRAIDEKFAITDPTAFRLGRRENSYLTTVWSGYWVSRWESPEATRFAAERERHLSKSRNARSEQQRLTERDNFKHFQREFDKIHKKDLSKFDAMVVDAVVENGKFVEQILTDVIDQIVEGRVPKLPEASLSRSSRPSRPVSPPSRSRKRSRSPAPSFPPPLFSGPSSRRSSLDYSLPRYGYGQSNSGRYQAYDDRYYSNSGYSNYRSNNYCLPPMHTGSRYYNI